MCQREGGAISSKGARRILRTGLGEALGGVGGFRRSIMALSFGKLRSNFRFEYHEGC
jgi:hypothetical protein